MEAIILTKDQYAELLTRLDSITNQLSVKTDAKKDTFLDNQEFLQLMKISKRTAQTWRDEGRISFSQVGNKIYYKLSDVEKLLHEHYNKAFSKKWGRCCFLCFSRFPTVQVHRINDQGSKAEVTVVLKLNQG